MKKILLVLATVALTTGLYAQNVLVGWHTFTGASTPVGNEAPDQVATGFTGVLGGEVNPAFPATGGGNGTGTGNSADNTFGQTISINPIPTVLNSCVKMSPTNNSKRRIDFQVTNNSGVSVTLEGIHFDYAYVWGADVSNLKISVVHFGAVSDLSGANTVLIDNIGFADSNDKNWHSIDVSLANMDNVSLADGEKAAFWIELPGSGVSSDGNVIIDNIAITDNTATKMDAPDLNNKVKVFPNPATDVINISASDLDITEVELLDLTGKVVYKSVSIESISVSDLPKSLYVLKLKTGKGTTVTRKVMVK